MGMKWIDHNREIKNRNGEGMSLQVVEKGLMHHGWPIPNTQWGQRHMGLEIGAY